MSMIDEQEWDNFEKPSLNDGENVESFTDVQWVSLTDTGSTQSQLKFDTLPIMNTPSIMGEAYLEMPILWSPSNPTVPYTPGVSQIAPKSSVSSLIKGVNFATASGAQIVNEAYQVWWENAIRPKIEDTPEGVQSFAKENASQPDSFPNYYYPGGCANSTGDCQLGERPGFGMQYAGLGTFTDYAASGTQVTLSPPYYDGAINPNLAQSDVQNQANPYKLGHGISSVGITSSEGIGNLIASPTLSAASATGNTALSAVPTATITGTFYVQVNPLTFSAPALAADVPSVKFLYCAPLHPITLGAVSNTWSQNSVTDSLSLSTSYAALSNINDQNHNGQQIYDADWPVIKVVFDATGTLTQVSIIHPGSGLMLLPAPIATTNGTNASNNQIVTLTLNSGAMFQDGRIYKQANATKIYITLGPVGFNPCGQGATSVPDTGFSQNIPPYGLNPLQSSAALDFGGQTPLVTLPIASRNPVYNKGFDERRRSWWNNSQLVQKGWLSYGGGGKDSSLYVPSGQPDVYLTWITIRLKDLHDHFRQLYWPMINVRSTLSLFFAAPLDRSAEYYGMLLGPGAPQMSPPIMAVADSLTGSSLSFKPGVSRLYVKTIRLDGPQIQKFRASLVRGIHKEITHIESELYNVAYNSITSTVNGVVTTSSTNVERVWVFGLPTGQTIPNAPYFQNSSYIALPSTSNTSIAATPMVRSAFSGITPTMRASVQLLVNQKPWRDVPESENWEYWHHLAEELRGSGEAQEQGAILNYDSWLQGTDLFYVFNLSRAGKRLNKKEPIQLAVNIARKADGPNGTYTPMDIYCFIEKTSNVIYKIDEGNASIVKTY